MSEIEPTREENIEEARHAVESAKSFLETVTHNLEKAEALLEKAQKPKIQLEHMGVYRLENGDVVEVTTRPGGDWVAFPIDGSAHSWYINNKGVAEHGGRPPVVEHIGKIGVVGLVYNFGQVTISNLCAVDPLNLNNK